jgi:hypothetical protein
MLMLSMIKEEPEAKRESLDKLNRIRQGRFIRVKSIADKYGL